jgi:hypothetical protein
MALLAFNVAMNRFFLSLFLLVVLNGCLAFHEGQKAPFPHSSFVAEYTSGDLWKKVIEQDTSRKHPAAVSIDDTVFASVITFKYCPNPKEFKKLESLFKEGDRLIEFKNDDWWVGYDCGSDDPERAFCLMRGGKIVRTVYIVRSDE